jgi:hypothetical protein
LAHVLDMKIIGELKQASARSLSVDINKSGSASFNFPMDHRYAKYINALRTCLIAQRGDEWFWSGPIHQVTRDFAAGKISATAVGWFDRLNSRFLPDQRQYADQDAGGITSDLLSIANGIGDTFIKLGTVEPSQLRTTTYARDANIGQEIQSLVELESGYDWYIDPVSRELNIVARRGQDRPQCKWILIGDGKSNMSNLKNVVETEDGSTVVNDITVRGKFNSAHADDVLSKSEMGTIQQVTTLSDVVDNDILNAYANAEIVYRKDPRRTYTITPKSSAAANVPIMGETFDLGDTTYLTARRGGVRIDDQAVRAFGVDLQIDERGLETITRLQTSL